MERGIAEPRVLVLGCFQGKHRLQESSPRTAQTACKHGIRQQLGHLAKATGFESLYTPYNPYIIYCNILYHTIIYYIYYNILYRTIINIL